MQDSTSETTSQTEDASVSINQISESSNKVATMLSSMQNILKSSHNGKIIAKNAQDKSKQTSLSISKLDSLSLKIDEIIKIISQIAFQTNILSLNAAVEASTAGEVGKGFAVVLKK